MYDYCCKNTIDAFCVNLSLHVIGYPVLLNFFMMYMTATFSGGTLFCLAYNMYDL